MTTREDKFKGVTIGIYKEDNDKLIKDMKKHINGEVVFFCVGTDRSTGDSFAPYVGTMLEEKGYKNVIGTIDDPAHAVNLEEKMKQIPEGVTVIAIDASLGKQNSLGTLKLMSGALYAGAGVGKDLPPVGDYQIQGMVNVDSGNKGMNQLVLQCTRFKVVMSLAKQLVAAIEEAYPLHNEVVNNTYITAVK
ncbi:spore protease YyaC [Priestia aryabhattai]|uniref:spore protease YyaC n=1 Tax=Priestia aryabhattai TaxID=412384 RepID=UPI0015F6898A|nr:spore protease YyaC [Priestia aryabhattai]